MLSVSGIADTAGDKTHNSAFGDGAGVGGNLGKCDCVQCRRNFKLRNLHKEVDTYLNKELKKGSHAEICGKSDPAGEQQIQGLRHRAC